MNDAVVVWVYGEKYIKKTLTHLVAVDFIFN